VSATAIYLYTLEKDSNLLYKYANYSIMGDCLDYCGRDFPSFLKDHNEEPFKPINCLNNIHLMMPWFVTMTKHLRETNSKMPSGTYAYFRGVSDESALSLFENHE